MIKVDDYDSKSYKLIFLYLDWLVKNGKLKYELYMMNPETQEDSSQF